MTPASNPDPVRPHECGYCGATYRRIRLAIDCCSERFEAGGGRE